MDVRYVVNQQSQLICHMKQNDRAKAEGKAEGKTEGQAEGKAKGKAEGKAGGKAGGKQKLTLQTGVCKSDSAAQARHDQNRQGTASALNGKSHCLIDIHCSSHVLE